jgi:hypothetical protein
MAIGFWFTKNRGTINNVDWGSRVAIGDGLERRKFVNFKKIQCIILSCLYIQRYSFNKVLKLSTTKPHMI